MASFSFLLLFLLQIASGYPFVFLFFFWHGVFSPLGESIFWSVLSGVSLGILFGNLGYWVFTAFLTALSLQFLNRYVIRRKTPFVLSLLFLLTITLWHIPHLAGMVDSILLLFFPLSFLFFLFYAIWIHQTKHQQKRLF